MDKGEIEISQQEYSDMIGVNLITVRSRISKGGISAVNDQVRPKTIYRDRAVVEWFSKGWNCNFNDEALAILHNNIDVKPDSASESVFNILDSGDFDELVTRHGVKGIQVATSAYRAKLAKIDHDERLRKLIPIEDLQQTVLDCNLKVKQAFYQIPKRVAPKLIGQDLKDVENELMKEIEFALQGLYDGGF